MCRSGCPTKDHKSWGECARQARLNVGYCGQGGGDATAQKAWDSELALYRRVRAQGIQPESTNAKHIREAVEASQAAGAAYGRDFAQAAPMEA